MSDLSSFLFATPSAIEGAARIMDFYGSLTAFNVSANPELADFYAIRSDWMAVGSDLENAMTELAKSSHVKGKKKPQ